MKKVNNELTRNAIGISLVILIWTLGVSGSLLWNKIIQDQETESFALIEADAVLFKDIVFRKWMTLKSNVYAPVSDITVPNPYLDVPERDVILPPGRRYTLINPAFMTREVHDLQNRERRILGHITSLMPIRPGNAPDAWEAEALRGFEAGKGDASARQYINGKLYYRLIKPLVTDASCLRCHAKQGYVVGKIRGGISVSVPLDPLIEASYKHFITILSAHSGIWMIGLLVIFFWTRFSRVYIRERMRHEKELLVKDTAIATSSNGIVLTDLAGNITYANDMFHKITRFEGDEPLTGRSLFEMLQIPDSSEILAQVIELKKWFAELTAVRHDSKEFYALISAALITAGGDEKVGITFSIADITMRKSAETALKESRESLRQRNETMEKDLMLAQLIQRELITMKIPGSKFLDMRYKFLPVEKVGGDFFSFYPTREDAMGVFIADVTGHGIAAALFHSLIKSATEKIGRDDSITPSEYMFRLNNELAGHMTSYFITAIYGIFQRIPGQGSVRFTFSNGGHPSPAVMRKGGGVEFHNARGTVVGQIRDFEYAETSILLEPGDRIFLFTDGLPETGRADRELVGYDDQLITMFESTRRDTVRDSLDAVIEWLNGFRGNVPFSDDILIIGIEIKA